MGIGETKDIEEEFKEYSERIETIKKIDDFLKVIEEQNPEKFKRIEGFGKSRRRFGSTTGENDKKKNDEEKDDKDKFKELTNKIFDNQKNFSDKFMVIKGVVSKLTHIHAIIFKDKIKEIIEINNGKEEKIKKALKKILLNPNDNLSFERNYSEWFKGKGKKNVIGIKKFLNTIYLLNYLYKFNGNVVEEVSEEDIIGNKVFGLYLTRENDKLNKLNDIVSGQNSAFGTNRRKGWAFIKAVGDVASGKVRGVKKVVGSVASGTVKRVGATGTELGN